MAFHHVLHVFLVVFFWGSSSKSERCSQEPDDPGGICCAAAAPKTAATSDKCFSATCGGGAVSSLELSGVNRIAGDVDVVVVILVVFSVVFHI